MPNATAIVADASALADLLLPTTRGRAVGVAIDDRSVHAPQLASIELTSVLRRMLARDDIDDPTASATLSRLDDLGVRWYDHQPLLGRVLELRANLSAYDALYVALAEGLAAPLLTTDARIGGAPELGVETLIVE